jgi:hypothetical protein
MNNLSIFLILLIFGYTIFSCKLNNKEPFSLTSCNTLRCEKNKYSVTSMKNTLSNKLTSTSSGHIANIKGHLTNLKEMWL